MSCPLAGAAASGINDSGDAYAYQITGLSYYVSQTQGDDSNDGSPEYPFATVAYALTQVSGGDVIYVGNGD